MRIIELIDKADLIAEVEKKTRGERGYRSEDAEAGYKDCAREILSFINALEVKEERIKDCHYRVVWCEKYLGTVTECNGACAWVVDCLKLKELKTKKGE